MEARLFHLLPRSSERPRRTRLVPAAVCPRQLHRVAHRARPQRDQHRRPLRQHPAQPLARDGGQKWLFYREGLSPAVIRIIEAVDDERTRLERALSLAPRRLTDMLYEFYGDQGMARPEDGLYTQLSTFGSFATVPGPLSWDHRFISEDLRCG
ncbi:MAG: NAD/NADP octopine/nopaline dehydrogenase family protein, partial [Pyramidobacter sp.]|nr:NAD/NADP octopine/nopaline dehydrogenase family protein [Pyramidobacter sp.]